MVTNEEQPIFTREDVEFPIVKRGGLFKNFVKVDFLIPNTGQNIVKETLRRIGYFNKRNEFIPICYCWCSRGDYFILHSKEVRMLLDGNIGKFSVSDLVARNKIVNVLARFNLVTILNKEEEMKVWEYEGNKFEDDGRFVYYKILKVEEVGKYKIKMLDLDGGSHAGKEN